MRPAAKFQTSPGAPVQWMRDNGYIVTGSEPDGNWYVCEGGSLWFAAGGGPLIRWPK